MSITKRERERQTNQENVLMSLGFTRFEAEKLRRISMTLSRWYELECGNDYGCIERDDTTGRPYWLSNSTMRRSLVADREKGARKRLGHIIGLRNTRAWVESNAPAVHEVAVLPYIQTDPRGAALYILRPGDLREGDNVESCYTRGICVY